MNGCLRLLSTTPSTPNRRHASRLRDHRILIAASLLALAVVDPGTAPLSPTDNNDAIHAKIIASNPTLTDSPASLERLLAATQLADEKLR